MTSDLVIELLRHALGLALTVVSPLLAAGLVVGLVIAIVQATTQIQESTLNFAPKVVAMGTALALLGPWALEHFVGFTTTLLRAIADAAPSHLGGL